MKKICKDIESLFSFTKWLQISFLSSEKTTTQCYAYGLCSCGQWKIPLSAFLNVC